MSERFNPRPAKPKGEVEKKPPGMSEVIANRPEDGLNKEGKTIDPNTSDSSNIDPSRIRKTDADQLGDFTPEFRDASDSSNIDPSRIRETDADQLGDFTPEFLAQELRGDADSPEPSSEEEPGENGNYY